MADAIMIIGAGVAGINCALNAAKYGTKVYLVDDTASIGRLYRRQDEIGTPFCITVDVESLEDNAVTIRDRDSMEQTRVPIPDVKRTLLDRLGKL